MNVPFLINAFFKVITPFVDPVTRPKMRFNPEIVKEGIFDKDLCWKEFGGDIEFVYEHEKYWPALIELVEERKKKKLEKWKKLGGTVGLKEWDFKRVDEESESEDKGGEKAEVKVDPPVDSNVNVESEKLSAIVETNEVEVGIAA